MEKRWELKIPADETKAVELSDELKKQNRNIPLPLVKLENLHDPFLMKDMDKAVERLQKAVKAKETIMIYGDYDVDGTTSVALMYLFLFKRHPNLYYYVPDRDAEGYGISERGIDFAEEKNVSLIIALDCGIKEIEKVKYALGKNIEMIICDHHNPGDKLPEAAAVLDPKRTDCPYPYKELSGCGVGFKFLQAFCIREDIPLLEIEVLLDLVAVSIASDIVPITGENRILATHGLRKLNSDPIIGLKSIIKTAGIINEITINDIVFKIGPRINAAGRIDYGRKAVELLISKNPVQADVFSQQINVFNTTRKELDNTITVEILEEILGNKTLQDKKTTVVYNAAWHKGVLGIVASRLTEHYYRPTIVLTESNGFATGSARSVDGFDLYSAISSCSDLLESYGGHMYAAGLTLKVENIRPLQERFEAKVSEMITPELSIPKIEIDECIQLVDVTEEFYYTLKMFEPYGPENMRPIFMSENVSDRGTGKKVGAGKEHLKLDLMEENNRRVYPAIGFQLANKFDIVSYGKKFKICYTIDENVFMGKTNIQLVIKDIAS